MDTAVTDYFDLAVTGDLVLPGRVLAGGTLAVRGEKIVAILAPDERVSAAKQLSYQGCYVLPGLVDTHVHTGSAASEGIATATEAAAVGGVTTIIDMPYDASEPVFTKERLLEKAREVAALATVDVGLYASMAKENGLRELEGLIDAGAIAFKFSLFETDPDRFPRIHDGDLLDALEFLSATDLPVVLHAESQEIIERRLSSQVDRAATAAHGRSRPVVSESAAVAKACEMAYWTGARVHIAHVTHPHVFKLIQYYLQHGARVSGETCVHYLALCDDDVRALGPIAKVNPPIRDRAAQEMLWLLLQDGAIASISTDHAPWPLHLKERPMLDAASGIPGLETFLPVLWTEAQRHGVSPWTLADHVSAKPAELFGLGATKGRLDVGYDADFVVFDPAQEWKLDASRMLTSAKWSPFHGWTLNGKVEATFLRGTPVFSDGIVTNGSGRWLRRDQPTGKAECIQRSLASEDVADFTSA